MKFLFVAARYHTNQVPVVEGLIGKGHEVHFWASYTGKTEDHAAVTPFVLSASWLSGLLIDRASHRSSLDREDIHRRWFFPAFFALLRALLALRPDVVICRGENVTTAMVTLICRWLGTPRVLLYTQKPVLRPRQQTLLKRLFFPARMMSPVLVANPRADPAPAMETALAQNRHFIPLIHAVTPQSDGRGYFRDNKLNILSVGKYRGYKNLTLLVEAVSCLHPAHLAQLTVTIVGQVASQTEHDYHERLRADIAAKGLGSVIALKSNVPYSQMDSLYQASDVFVLTSLREVASVAVVEAMASGLVVVSTDENGTASYVEPGVSGDWFETDNAASLAGVLARLITADQPSLAAMGQAARERARLNCSFEVYYGKLLAALDLA